MQFDDVLPETVIAVTAAFAVCAILTSRVRAFVLTRGIVDVPNERSSHKVATPRGGGVAIILTTNLALVIFALLDVLPLDLFLAFAGGGNMVAAIGFLDDRKQLRAGVRLAVHFAAALWGLACFGGLPTVHLTGHVAWAGWIGYALGSLGIVWTLNLFNFMDGIDGLAASEAAFVSCSGALLALMLGMSAAVPAFALIFGATCCGFLLWNWPPAKIFMGDVGSGYLGYVIAILAVAASRDSSVMLVIWLLLGGVFFVDATVTLIKRVLRGERVSEAHRTHAYQWLARRWTSHRRVTATVLVVNLVWLLPCALMATVYERFAWWILLLAFTPLTIGAIAAGAGRRETTENIRAPE